MQTQRDDAAVIPHLGRYEIDASRSTVTFRTRHLFGLAPVRGSFAIQAGVLDVTEPLADSSIHVEIATASFHTGNGQRDANVRSARLLDAAQYPVMAFTLERIDRSALIGCLTVRDVSRPLTLSIGHVTVSPRSFAARATTRIDRTEFGLTGYRGLAGRYLQVSMELHWVLK